MTELTPGLELAARFVLIRRLGRGGIAEVWLADDRERGEPVALKILDRSDPPDAGFAARIADEVARARSLPREFTLAVHDVVTVDERTLIVMEYAPGGDLGQFRGRSFESWSKAVDEVAAALAAAHAAGLVHRDLKCGNVLLGADGRARLADFGLAALVGSKLRPGGSPYNASPQQLRGEPAAIADDLYAFGALLYELIAGHPPWYPEISRDRVLHEPVPPLLPRGDVPIGVRELALRLLAKSPQERPAGAQDVRARLAAVAAGADDIMPFAHELPVQTAGLTRGSRTVPVALGLAGAALIGVLLWLSQRYGAGNPGIERAAREQAEALARERQTREQSIAEQATAKVAAEAARDAFAAAFQALDARAAARWATAPFAEARDGGARAAQHYAVGRYADAKQAWEEANAKLAGLDKERPAVLKDALQRGQQALAAGDTVAARTAFELALAIEAGHAQATAGVERAGRIDQANAMADVAAGHERAGRLADAEQGYRKALAIDSAATGASEGLARIAAKQSGDAYAAAMSRGFADLAAGRGDSARAAFRQALALRPGSREASEALAAIDQGQKSAALALLESRARGAEADERWDDALTAWREAAGLDAGLVAAREGIARATPRAELQRRIDALNREPERLWNPEGRAEARTLVATAAAAGNPRQRLARAAGELERLAGAAQTPVRLRLESDGITSVTIYRVGQYGSFARREVELLPGRYTVVGTRNGYRDVRREVVLPPGAGASAVVVRCEEPI